MLPIIIFCLLTLVFWGRALAFAAYFVSRQPILDTRFRRYTGLSDDEKYTAALSNTQESDRGGYRPWHFI